MSKRIHLDLQGELVWFQALERAKQLRMTMAEYIVVAIAAEMLDDGPDALAFRVCKMERAIELMQARVLRIEEAQGRGSSR